MGSCSGAVSTIVQNWREHPPSSFSLKIHNFSQLEHSTASSDHKYQSRLFSSCGYNWRLVIYPKGNRKDNGKGFISMYVEIHNNSLKIFTPPTQVFAELRFFVYNKKDNKYFTIQDVEVKRFNALKTGSNVVSKGDSRADGKWLSIFLYLADGETPKPDEKIFAKAKVQLLSLLGSNHSAHQMSGWHREANSGWGWSKFLSLDELRKSFLDKEDALNIEVEFQVVSATKYSPIV
ncbi:hypothetical protein AALP_AA2G066300 [Arabis alpina]|uniref:MATH domain-containing protein n=1 Tax=Arabis alpina TaxID=50452 RepID=A0A087HFQ4_ARAAL|nr:hypothetical protein AALP_AA2G066300 [Arabis alpina]